MASRIHIPAQDPRAIAVRGGQLYVAVFESGNTSELSMCPSAAGPPSQCTLDLDDFTDFVVVSPNIPGSDARIVKDPDLPDRDLYVFDTTTDLQISGSPVDAVGTLLYGLAVDSNGEVFISQVEARNDVNDQDGENLVVLENRMFFNQIARVDCGGGSCGGASLIELEPALPSQPASGDALGTPYGIQISADDSTLVATAAASSRVFTVSTATGSVLDRLDVGAIPRGVAFDSIGATGTAYVLNTLGNSVSVVTVGAGGSLTLVTTIRDANPHGPYILGGYCIGGIFAYEVARQIRASGEEVPLLVIIDAVNKSEFGFFARWAARWRTILALRAKGDHDRLKRIAFNKVLSALFQVPGLGRTLRRRYTERTYVRRLNDPNARISDRAYSRYRPSPYGGRIVLYTSEENRTRLATNELGWGRLAEAGLEIVDLPVTHYGFMSREIVEMFADDLRERIVAARPTG